jgi:hypothetical protein
VLLARSCCQRSQEKGKKLHMTYFESGVKKKVNNNHTDESVLLAYLLTAH